VRAVVFEFGGVIIMPITAASTPSPGATAPRAHRVAAS